MSIVNERGFLNDDGKKFVEGFVGELKRIYGATGSEKELRVLQSILANIVGDEAAKMIAAKQSGT